MSSDKDNITDSNAQAGQGIGSGVEKASDGAERRHYPRKERSLRVTFTYDGEEFRAHTVDVSKSGALFASTVAPSVGTELLLLLQDSRNPNLKAHLKSKVMRHGDSRGRRKEFAVQFGDAVSKDPTVLGRFLNQVLNIANGLIRVAENSGGERVFAFSFDTIHREGSERIKALQSSLFSSLDEMEEADSILSSFGKSSPAQSISSSKPEKEPPEPPPASSSQKQKKPEKPRTLGLEALLDGENSRNHEEIGLDDLPDPDVGSQSEEAPLPSKEVEPGKSEALTEEAGKSSELKQTETGKPRKKGGSFLSKLLSRGTRGKAAITGDSAPMMVAREAQVDVGFKGGGKSGRARGVRLYCAGMKCETEGELPQLYTTVTLEIPLPGRRRKTIELWGDITRIRPRDDEDGGVFEVRFSMRNSKGDMEAYRRMLDKLVKQDQKEIRPTED